MHGDTSALSTTGYMQLQYSAVNKHTAYTKEGYLCQFNKVQSDQHMYLMHVC